MTKKFIVGGVVVAVVLSLTAFFKVVTLKFPSPENPTGAIEFNTGKVVHNQLAESVQQRRQVVLTQAQINDLSNDEDGIELIPSPGSDKVIIVESIVGFNRFASEGWSRGTGESFEIKWDSGTLASGGNNRVALGASFSNGFLTRAAATSITSKSVEVWYPYNPGSFTEADLIRSRVASSSAVVLTGLSNPSNVETTGITDFVFEVFYRILPRP